MSEIGEKEREELEMLMPWYVNGTLDRASSQRIEEALKSDAVLARSRDVLTEDREATLALAEADELPASMEARFMAQLDAEPHPRAAAAQKRVATTSLLSTVGEWLGDFFVAMTPGRLAVAVAAACLLVVVQSGVIVSLLGQGEGFETASGPSEGAAGPAMLVQFAAGAELASVTAFLDSNGGRIVDGPLPGGMFRLQFADADESEAETILARLREQPQLFSLVLPAN